ncbi:hypothetical protein PR048_008351 [Dryococelus australis]|uniref:EGF-like domain-containing protein n=1 Tax=Dryococelus australis TaxID=614101 RepID=A0ABQ9HWV3_9NEOP|nr:hypothetical protein PR048_008351 [Dryococelus australis]
MSYNACMRFAGSVCEEEVDGCESSPCLHGGSCTNQGPNYTCSCPPGFTGVSCEVRWLSLLHKASTPPHAVHKSNEVDECESSPCLNGGSCEDSINEYVCLCTDGFQGAEVSMEKRRNARAGETGYTRENTPTSGIVRHDFTYENPGATHPGIESGSLRREAIAPAASLRHEKLNGLILHRLLRDWYQQGNDFFERRSNSIIAIDLFGWAAYGIIAVICYGHGTNATINFFECSIYSSAAINDFRHDVYSTIDFFEWVIYSIAVIGDFVKASLLTAYTKSPFCAVKHYCNGHMQFMQGVTMKELIEICKGCKDDHEDSINRNLHGDSVDSEDDDDSLDDPTLFTNEFHSTSDVKNAEDRRERGTCCMFAGDRCEEDMDECEAAPCMNEATCVDGVASYSCECRQGYVGTHCEDAWTDPCAVQPCDHGATCLSDDNVTYTPAEVLLSGNCYASCKRSLTSLVSEEIWAALNSEVLRVNEENPPISGIVRHYSHLRKPVSDPAGLNPVRLGGRRWDSSSVSHLWDLGKIPAGLHPDPRVCETWRMLPVATGFSQRTPVTTAITFRCFSAFSLTTSRLQPFHASNFLSRDIRPQIAARFINRKIAKGPFHTRSSIIFPLRSGRVLLNLQLYSASPGNSLCFNLRPDIFELGSCEQENGVSEGENLTVTEALETYGRRVTRKQAVICGREAHDKIPANEKQGHCDVSPTQSQLRQPDKRRFYLYFPPMSDSSVREKNLVGRSVPYHMSSSQLLSPATFPSISRDFPLGRAKKPASRRCAIGAHRNQHQPSNNHLLIVRRFTNLRPAICHAHTDCLPTIKGQLVGHLTTMI